MQELKDSGLIGARVHGRRPAVSLAVERRTVEEELVFKEPGHGTLLLCRSSVLFKESNLGDDVDLSRESVSATADEHDTNLQNTSEALVQVGSFTAMFNSAAGNTMSSGPSLSMANGMELSKESSTSAIIPPADSDEYDIVTNMQNASDSEALVKVGTFTAMLNSATGNTTSPGRLSLSTVNGTGMEFGFNFGAGFDFDFNNSYDRNTDLDNYNFENMDVDALGMD